MPTKPNQFANQTVQSTDKGPLGSIRFNVFDIKLLAPKTAVTDEVSLRSDLNAFEEPKLMYWQD